MRLPDPAAVERALVKAPVPPGFALRMSPEDPTRPWLILMPQRDGVAWVALVYAVTKDGLPLWRRWKRNGFVNRRRVEKAFRASVDPVANLQRMLLAAAGLEDEVVAARRQQRKRFVEKPRKRRCGPPLHPGVKWSEEKSCPSGNPLRLCLHCGRPNHRRRTPCTRNPLAGWTPREHLPSGRRKRREP